jgi:hypothetical protein
MGFVPFVLNCFGATCFSSRMYRASAAIISLVSMDEVGPANKKTRRKTGEFLERSTPGPAQGDSAVANSDSAAAISASRPDTTD